MRRTFSSLSARWSTSSASGSKIIAAQADAAATDACRPRSPRAQRAERLRIAEQLPQVRPDRDPSARALDAAEQVRAHRSVREYVHARVVARFDGDGLGGGRR